jgi:hypothetical protein
VRKSRFTVALSHGKSITRVKFDRDNRPNYVLEPVFHDNPIDAEGGSLVVTDWGQDIGELIDNISSTRTGIYNIRDTHFGLVGEFLDVIVTRKFG